MTMENDDRDRDRLKEIILELIEERGPGKTICPSEAARKFRSNNWRRFMDTAREAVRDLKNEGKIEIFQHGKIVDIDAVSGPIRVGLPEKSRP